VEVLSSRTLIHPADLQRSLDFYGDRLGLAVAYEFGEGDHRGTVYFAGNGLVEVVGRADPPTGPSPVALWLQVRSAAAAVAELEERGVAVDRGPVLEPWGLIEAWVHDPDGHRIHLVEVPPGHPLRRDPRSPDTMAVDL
jgi:catechol 2,3-dioxygenase-like lactoylglutathione lyase family enzyme